MSPNVHVYPAEGHTLIMTDLARLPTCRLTKLRTDDGRWHFFEGRAFVGKVYRYSPKSRRVETIFNKPRNEEFQCEIVLVFDDVRKCFGMMPVECLDFSVLS